MRKIHKLWIGCFLILCMMGMSLSVCAKASEDTSYGVELSNWKRRIYRLWADASPEKGSEIRIYAGKDYHLTDSQGDILSEDTYIDSKGNETKDTSEGKVCRDKNGWYVLWSKSDSEAWGEHSVYVQADVEFDGGNNQRLSVRGLSGIYNTENAPEICFDYDTIAVNVASEVQVSDVEIPVMKGMNVNAAKFLSKANVMMEAVYGNLRDLPIVVEWYRVDTDTSGEKTETLVGEPLTSMPYSIPESELKTLSEHSCEYLVKVYYNGEASTEEAKANTNGYENVVSLDEAMDKATFKTELITGHIDVTVELEKLPYNNAETSNTFKFRLYHFEQQNQIIQEDTPYTLHSVTFERNGSEITKTFEIDGLEAGWYSLVPEVLEAGFVEKAEERWDNRGEDGRTGSAAGIDFYIGEIVENAYIWENIRYQGQDTKDPLSDNFFKIVYRYRENVYQISYKSNLPEGASLCGGVPVDSAKYKENSAVTVQGGDTMECDGWQFVGWSLEAGDGIYHHGDTLYAQESVHDIPVNKKITMSEGGITLYAKWMPVYEVNYHGNTHTSGELPSDTNGTVKAGKNIYYSGDSMTVKAAGNLKKQDADGTIYEFVGWSLSRDGSGIRYHEGDTIYIEDTDINLYAQWKAVDTNQFAVNYIVVVPKGASLLGQPPTDIQKYTVGDTVTVKGRGTMDIQYYRFAGWSLTSNEDGIYEDGEEIFGTKELGKTVTHSETVMKEQGLNFYSRWIPLYQVLYYANGNVTEGVPVDTHTYQSGDMVTILDGTSMVRPGYEFIGWNTKIDGSGENYDSSLKFNMPAENIELYAQWKKLPERESDMDDSKNPPSKRSAIPLVILSIIATACITAYVVYQLMIHRKHK